MPPPDDAKLRALLREARPAPELPPGFQDAVWRRIERAEAPGRSPGWSWLGGVAEALLRPRMVIAGVSAMLVLGGAVGVLDGFDQARKVRQARYVSAVAPWQGHSP